MRNLIFTILFSAMSFTAYAETLPTLFQKAEGGNAKWAQRVVKEWNKYLGNDGHKVVIRYMPRILRKHTLSLITNFLRMVRL